jgi:lipopolysaccharide/colanic/teichoic acid biosynthesis glycosyltransferase
VTQVWEPGAWEAPSFRSTDAVKRVFDIALTLLAAPVWIPVLGTAVLMTWHDSGRPILFVQVRMGRSGRPFRMLKVRTMQQGADSPGDALFSGWTYVDDPRVTPVGRKLRRYRLDELPQLMNVLCGDMSLVGPRPEPWEVAVALCRQIPGYWERHAVRPGLTGLCQISPIYCEFGTIEQARAKCELDLLYIRTRSLRVDIQTLVSTIRVLVKGTGVA